MSTESPALSPLAGPTPLHRVYVLEPAMDDGRPDDITIVPATAREAFLAFVRSSFQLHLDDPERSRGMFERIGALVEAVCVRRLAYPRDLERLPELVETILSDAGVATLASSEGSACN